ncbi:MAG: hypothetical protein [Bacteriophage sp.]|nr:MAG: hypothetical protein [Bacteriophage sp.]
MKNYEPIEQQHMADARSGALMFWLSLVACVLLAL